MRARRGVVVWTHTGLTSVVGCAGNDLLRQAVLSRRGQVLSLMITDVVEARIDVTGYQGTKLFRRTRRMIRSLVLGRGCSGDLG